MATTPAGATEHRESRAQDRTSKSELVVVDLGEAQSTREVRRLRKGRGKLMNRVERIVDDLVDAGTIKSTAQPVVIVVRESVSPFSFLESDD